MNNTSHTSRRAFSARTAFAAAAFALACAGCATDQPFAGLGNILGSPAKAQTASAQNSVLAAAQSKVAAGADVKALREELSNVITGGCYGDEHYDDWGCLARAYTPAAAEDRLEAARFLLDNGVGVNQKKELEQEDSTPLAEALSLLCSERLVIRDANDERNKDAEDATRERMSKLAVLFVSRGANINGSGGGCSWYEGESSIDSTPLGMAAEYGSAELVSLLLEKGAKVNKSAGRYYDIEQPDAGVDRGAPLRLAAGEGRAEIVKLLLAKGAKDKAALEAAQAGLKNADTEVKKNQFRETISMLKAAGAGKSSKKAATNKKR